MAWKVTLLRGGYEPAMPKTEVLYRIHDTEAMARDDYIHHIDVIMDEPVCWEGYSVTIQEVAL